MKTLVGIASLVRDKTEYKELEMLRSMNKAIPKLGRQLHEISNKMGPYDIYLITILNRTLNINRGFDSLMTNNNFIAAAPLVRLNVDSMLGLFAPRLCNLEFNECVLKIMDGKHISDLKSKERTENNKLKKLTDRYIARKLSELNDFDWVTKLYTVGSSFIHMSNLIMSSAQQVEDSDERIMNMTIGEHDAFIAESEKLGAIHWMIKTTDGIIQLSQIWMVEKAQKLGFDITKLDEVEY